MPKKILIIDDEPHIVKTLQSRLSARHYSVITAFDGNDGLHKIKTEKPDLLILDLMMPEMDGYTFIKAIRADKTIVQPPIIVVTVKEKREIDFDGDMEIQGYIVKPFNAAELEEKISEILE